jgi:hypothetical protein
MKEKPSLNLYFPAADKVQPKGFTDASVGETVTITIKGKLTRLEDSTDQWDPGKRLGMTITGCEIVAKQKPMSLSKALTESRRKV